MTLVTRTTEYPNGTIVTERFEQDFAIDQAFSVAAPFDQENSEPSESESEPYTIEFLYHGQVRTVANPKIGLGRYDYRTGFNYLLCGVELESGHYKNFNLCEIKTV